jgi:hypothetical protein
MSIFLVLGEAIAATKHSQSPVLESVFDLTIHVLASLPLVKV